MSQGYSSRTPEELFVQRCNRQLVSPFNRCACCHDYIEDVRTAMAVWKARAEGDPPTDVVAVHKGLCLMAEEVASNDPLESEDLLVTLAGFYRVGLDGKPLPAAPDEEPPF